MKTIKTSFGKEVKIFADIFEQEAYDQIKRLANFEAYKDSQIRIMPDAHAGKGCTVGTTMTIKNKVSPSLVGVDICCGVLTVKINTNRIDFLKLDNVIKEFIPHGFNIHKHPLYMFPFNRLKCRKHIDKDRALLSIGTLGGGNHFIEVDYSEKDNCHYLVIHTGSRNLGVQVCKYYQDLAWRELKHRKSDRDELIAKLKEEGREKEISIQLKKLAPISVPKELAYLQGESFSDYIEDMKCLHDYALANRTTIAGIITGKMEWDPVYAFDTVHNYIDTTSMILRKGSVAAHVGQKLIIPINMRDGSLICIGKGNEDWNYSAPHGAGRILSRSKAKESLDMDVFYNSMKDVYTTSICEATLDEAPQAYKPIEEIREAIKDTVMIIDEIKPVYNFKSC